MSVGLTTAYSWLSAPSAHVWTFMNATLGWCGPGWSNRGTATRPVACGAGVVTAAITANLIPRQPKSHCSQGHLDRGERADCLHCTLLSSMEPAGQGAAASGGPPGLSIRAPDKPPSPLQQGGQHGGGSAGGASEGAISLVGSDKSLGSVTHHLVQVQQVPIGAHQALVFHCPGRHSSYAHVKDSEQCQQGQVRVVARCKRRDDGTFRYVSPYQYYAVKIQDKVSVAFRPCPRPTPQPPSPHCRRKWTSNKAALQQGMVGTTHCWRRP